LIDRAGCPTSGTRCGHSACMRVLFPVEAVLGVPQHPPDEVPDEGATIGTSVDARLRARASGPAANSCDPLWPASGLAGHDFCFATDEESAGTRADGRLAVAWTRHGMARVERIVVSRAVLVVLRSMRLASASLLVHAFGTVAAALSASGFIMGCSMVNCSGLMRWSTSGLENGSAAPAASCCGTPSPRYELAWWGAVVVQTSLNRPANRPVSHLL
jgi:hypothetical protein